ncbi:MAG: exodeoxyribonuclease V subunit gamma [Pseudomonadota bacterium]
MIHVRQSNRAEALLTAMAAALPAPGDARALFDGPWLIIPSRPLELFVDLELARRRGISGGIDTMSLRGAFARLCAESLPDVVLIDRGHVVSELLAALFEPAIAEGVPPFGPIAGYLRAAGTAPEAVDRRRVDLARALGALFDDWALTQPERLLAWQAADEAPRPAARTAPLEQAERALWTLLFGAGGRFARRGTVEKRRYLTLPGLLAAGLDEQWRPPDAVHVFGLADVTRGTQLALGRLGARTDLFLYATTPCGQFWEDVDTRRRRRPPPPRAPRARRTGQTASRQLELSGLDATAAGATATATATERDAGDALIFDARESEERENPLLRVWGHAGRETTRLLEQLAEGSSSVDLVNPVGGEREGAGSAADEPTGAVAPLLARLQQDVLDRAPARTGARRLAREPDASLAVLGASSPRRELETVAAHIWDIVRSTADSPAPLRFSDIAVLVAGADEPYLSLARPIFREASDLPHNIVDAPLTATSHVIEAVLALLALPLGHLTRREVLDVITHPNVRARFPDADPKAWLALCEALAIAHGADQAALADTYIDGDLFNWDQGCKRLALGVFARGPRSGSDDPIDLKGSPPARYVPAEVAPDLRPHADALAALVRSLLADARYARHAHLTIGDWTRFVRALVASYIVPTSPDDETTRLLVFTALDQMATQAAPDLRVGLGVAVELMRAALAGLRGSRGQILGAGVVVGTLASLRGVPFRALFVVGLDPARFPAADRPSVLDLAANVGLPGADPGAERALAGDVSPRQRDRGLFLDALLAARERLVLSYVDRDALTGEPREPSPVVLELLDLLARGYLRAGADVTRRAPLHRDEDPLVREAFPAAEAESRARAVGDRLRASVPQAAAMNATAIARGLTDEARRSLSPLLGIIDAPDAADQAGLVRSGQPRVIRLTDLRRFLECPLQGSARVFLGLRDLPDDSDERETEDEPFDLPRNLERALLGDVFTEAWNGPAVPDAAALTSHYDQGAARRRRDRLLPAGLFRANVRQRHLRLLQQWSHAVAAGGDGVPDVVGPARRVCIGRPPPFAPPDEQRAPIRLRIEVAAGQTIDVELHGTTEPVVNLGATNLGTITGSLVLATLEDAARNDRDALRAFIDQMALAASAPGGAPPARSAAAICRPTKNASGPSLAIHHFPALDVAAARDYLAGLVAEMLAGVHAYLFPCEAVFRSLDGGSMSLTERIDQVRTDDFYRRHSSSNWGPVPDPFEYPTPDAARAQAMLAGRFGPFLVHHKSATPRDKAGPGKRAGR